ncbi:MAG: ATP-binding cassette domain-containing protein [Bacilli bacterium]|jgi:energy-coupling factor transport system ATP-binding protein|nr:ATP-binding cassette domain-containing protein [Bacilli bacterium]
MSEIIQTKNLSFRYDTELIFYRLNLSVKTGEWVTVIGPNGSGKTTLLKLLTGLLYNDSEIVIDGIRLKKNNLKTIRKKIGVIFDNVDNQFVTETVKSEIAFTMENLQYKRKEINHRIEKIARQLKIEHLLDQDPHHLSGGEKQKVALASILALKPKIILLDESFSMLDVNERKEILDILKQIQKEEDLTILNITHNLEEAYWGERLIVLYNRSILIDGPTLDVFAHDKLLNRAGLEIPFMVDLSMKLKLYGLIDRIILDMDELVDALWK